MQIGLSPKVKSPALVLAGVGLALVVAGVLLPDPTIKTLGYGALGSAVTGLGIGYHADPGEVLVDVGPASDSLLGAEAAVTAETGLPPDPDDELDPPADRPAP